MSDSSPAAARRRQRVGEVDLRSRASAVQWLVLDVDGVLSEKLWYDAEGREFLKPFSVKDGLGIVAAKKCDLEVALLSARSSEPLAERARDLGITETMLGEKQKLAALEAFMAARELEWEAIAAIGDDLPDLPVLERAAISFAPADAARDVREVVHRVLESRGGRGAVREAIEWLLRARGQWQAVVDGYRELDPS